MARAPLETGGRPDREFELGKSVNMYLKATFPASKSLRLRLLEKSGSVCVLSLGTEHKKRLVIENVFIVFAYLSFSL